METPFRIADEVREALASGSPWSPSRRASSRRGSRRRTTWPRLIACAAAVRAGGAVPAAIGGHRGANRRRGLRGRARSPRRSWARPGEGRRPGPLLRSSRRDATPAPPSRRRRRSRRRCGYRCSRPAGSAASTGSRTASPPRARPTCPPISHELARSPVCVVCAGPKAILDVAATAEALETLGIPVLGWRTSELPAFYSDGSGVALEHRVDDADRAARVLALHWGALGAPRGRRPRRSAARARARARSRGGGRGGARRCAGPRRAREGGHAVPARGRRAGDAGAGARAANLALLERNAAVAGRDRGRRSPRLG